jgi:ABC-type sugar transport system ATPase subunit
MENYLEFRNIKKGFVGVQALDGISFRAEGGQVTALLGENGAGKSTLLKILSGDYQADSGEYFINGEEVRFENPLQGIHAGVSIIYQERQLVGNLTVTENVFMEDLYSNKFGVVDYHRCNKEMKELLDAFKMPFSPTTKVKELSVAHQQMVEIMKAYRRNSKIIAFDEPTASLSDAEINVLFELIQKLKEQGKVILYVSHRLAELYKITDKIVILKDGHFVECVDTADVDDKYLVSKMVGRDLGNSLASQKRNHELGDVVLEAKHLNSETVHDVSFSLRAGEVLGFAGLVGAGRSETMQIVFGADKCKTGEILINGKPCKIRSPKDAIRQGICLCPEDRKEQGLVLNRSVRENLTIPILSKLTKQGVISRKIENQICSKTIDKYKIKTSSGEKVVMELSGGNQQKVILGRWMLADLKVLILDEPTKGIDVGAKAEIYQMIRELAATGIAVILISSELPEVIGLCDRVLVMREGMLTGQLDKDDLSEEGILSLAMQ